MRHTSSFEAIIDAIVLQYKCFVPYKLLIILIISVFLGVFANLRPVDPMLLWGLCMTSHLPCHYEIATAIKVTRIGLYAYSNYRDFLIFTRNFNSFFLPTPGQERWESALHDVKGTGVVGFGYPKEQLKQY